MIELWYETHSISVDNERGIATGWLPGELSPAGRRLSGELGKRLKERAVQAIFSSDLHRAVETAGIARRRWAAPVILDDRLREANYGALNGAPLETVHAERLRRIERPFPDGESYVDVIERTRGFLLSLGQDWEGTSICIVAHSANRWAIDWLLDRRPIADSVVAPFAWRPGWRYELDGDWRGRLSGS